MIMTTPLPQAKPLADTGNFLMNSPRDHYKASDDPVSRYTILLNYCTGDVERFCAELQGGPSGRKLPFVDVKPQVVTAQG